MYDSIVFCAIASVMNFSFLDQTCGPLSLFSKTAPIHVRKRIRWKRTLKLKIIRNDVNMIRS